MDQFNNEAFMANDVGVDFGFFTKEEAGNINSGNLKDSGSKKASGGSSPKPKATNINVAAKPTSTDALVNIETVNYAQTYEETNSLVKSVIAQADELSSEIKRDINDIRSSKTLKGKYTYITNLTSAASSLLGSKISAIKELNSVITQGHNLELNRMKALKLDAKDDNDDMKIMDMYSAFINTPIGTYAPPAPSIQDITIGVNAGPGGNVNGVEMVAPATINGGPGLNPEQNRMRMESNPNIQTVVRYDQSTGMRSFDVIDKSTGMSVPNYPRPDNFLLEDTTIDVHTGIARNRNINTVWPLVLDGNSSFVTEY